MTRTGVGTIIGRKSVSKGKEYARIWIYVTTKVSEDTAFPFQIGTPCLVGIDQDNKRLIISTIDEPEAKRLGWSNRKRKRKSGTN